MSTATDKAFFHRDGDWIVANDACRGPWSADACHAGPVTGTMARAVERAVAGKQLVRLTLSFQRPIPMGGFRISAKLERDGRAATSASAELHDRSGRICAVASSLHLTSYAPTPFPTPSIAHPVFAEAKKGRFPVEKPLHDLPFFGAGIEVAYPPGESGDPGPTTVWMRTLPLFDDEDPSPFQTLCPIADCGNGISRNAEFAVASFVNADLTVLAYRLPESKWIASSAISFWEPNGIGMSQATLFDTRGALGVALQTLIIRPTS
ncbi:MAG: thioesterase family protein [Woeseiaceae bacterium]|nr:thioesterase family protein [Woeseiaceae bacterium]